MRTVRLMLVVVIFAALGCAAGTQGGSRSTSSRNVISAEQLANSLDRDVYDVIRRLRPAWLRPRGNLVALAFVDNTRLGDLEQLRSIAVEIVQEVRYYSATDATTRFGTGYPGGVVQVITKR